MVSSKDSNLPPRGYYAVVREAPTVTIQYRKHFMIWGFFGI